MVQYRMEVGINH